MQDGRYPIANALELRLSCTIPWIWCHGAWGLSLVHRVASHRLAPSRYKTNQSFMKLMIYCQSYKIAFKDVVYSIMVIPSRPQNVNSLWVEWIMIHFSNTSTVTDEPWLASVSPIIINHIVNELDVPSALIIIWLGSADCLQYNRG